MCCVLHFTHVHTVQSRHEQRLIFLEGGVRGRKRFTDKVRGVAVECIMILAVPKESQNEANNHVYYRPLHKFFNVDP